MRLDKKLKALPKQKHVRVFLVYTWLGSKEASFPPSLSLFFFFLKRYLNTMATAFNPFLVWHNQIWKRLAVCCNQIQAGQSCKEITSHVLWNNEWIDHIGLPSFLPSPPSPLTIWSARVLAFCLWWIKSKWTISKGYQKIQSIAEMEKNWWL